MDLKKLYSLKEMHSFQVIAIFGVIMSGGAHLIMLLLDREVPSFNFIYPTWLAIFLLGWILNITSKGGHDHHHH